MGRIFPTEIKDAFEMTPAGTYLFQVTEAAEAWVGGAESQVYGVEIIHTAVEPAAAAGVEHKESFFLGVHEDEQIVKDGKLAADPEAKLDETLKARSGRLKKYLSHFGIELEGADIEVVLQTLIGKQVMARIEHVASKRLRDDGTPFVNARAVRWFAPGEVKPELAPVVEPTTAAPGNGSRPAGPAAGPRPAAPAPVAAPAAAAAAPATRPAMRRIGR